MDDSLDDGQREGPRRRPRRSTRTARPSVERKKVPSDDEENEEEEEEQAEGGSSLKWSGPTDESSFVSSEKRREQNRAAQRSFRQRKIAYVKDLEKKVASHKQEIRQLQDENDELKRTNQANAEAASQSSRKTSSSEESTSYDPPDLAPLSRQSSAPTTSAPAQSIQPQYMPYSGYQMDEGPSAPPSSAPSMHMPYYQPAASSSRSQPFLDSVYQGLPYQTSGNVRPYSELAGRVSPLSAPINYPSEMFAQSSGSSSGYTSYPTFESGQPLRRYSSPQETRTPTLSGPMVAFNVPSRNEPAEEAPSGRPRYNYAGPSDVRDT